MRHAVRPLALSAADEQPLARVREPLALIEAQAKLLLQQRLTDTQRLSALDILRQAETLERSFNARPAEAGAVETSAEASANHDGVLIVPPAPIGARAANCPHILLADDDDEMLELLSEILSDRYQLTVARDGAEAVAALRAHTFSLAIVDLNLPVLDGFAVAEAMHALERPVPPFMYLSAQSSPQAKVRGLSLGAADYVTKPFDPDELTARIARIIAGVTREASLRAEAMTDSLTGLANYRSFNESLLREVARSRRYGQPLSLVTVDLDHLKAINDEHGHDAGNDAITRLAEVLKGAVRSFDVVARQGGDEFAVLLPNTDAVEAMALAHRLRDELGAVPLRARRLSASIGVASRDTAIDLDATALVKASDEALYRAKRAGRDRAELAGVP